MREDSTPLQEVGRLPAASIQDRRASDGGFSRVFIAQEANPCVGTADFRECFMGTARETHEQVPTFVRSQGTFVGGGCRGGASCHGRLSCT